jgi:Protein of unknown function (DUF3426)
VAPPPPAADSAPVSAAPTEPPAPQEPADAAADIESVPDEALEFNPEHTDAGSVFVKPQPDPQWAAATGTFKAMVAANQEPVLELEPDPQSDQPLEVEIDAGFLASIIQADRDAAAVSPAAEALAADVDLEQDDKDQEDAATSTAAEGRNGAPHAPRHARPPAEAQARHRGPALEETDEFQSQDSDAGGAEESQPLLAVARSWLAHRGWAAGAAVALLALVAQIINHNRDALAADARFGRPLTAFYGALGVQLMPRWDLRAYDVRQLGASTDAQHSGQITVRASIKNAGQRSQPLPLLRVTLEDRFGNRIAARDVQPRFYLPGAVPSSALLGAGQRIDAEMAFVDPGADAVGFELDACLPVRGGGIACANDASPR